MRVSSPKNPLLKEIRKAVERGSLTASGLAVAEGFHLLEEAGRSPRCVIETLVVAESVPHDGPSIVVPDEVLASVAATENTQGIIALVRPPEELETVPRDGVTVVLDGIQDPGNAGAILRAAEAFGARAAVFARGSVNPWNPKAIRASAGSVFRIPLRTGVTDPAAVIPADLPVFAAMPRDAQALEEAALGGACVIVIGSEGRGIGEAWAARARGVSIPTTGVESLNAAVAAAIILYEAARQRRRFQTEEVHA